MPDAKLHLANFTVPNQLRVEALSFDGDSMTIHASTGRSAAGSPLCGRPSRRINGRYTCTLADLPWCGVLVRLRVRVGKFFCDEPSCERKFFAERLDEAARPFARGIYCRREALEWIGFALGGEAAATVPGSEEGRLPGSIDSDASDVGSNR